MWIEGRAVLRERAGAPGRGVGVALDVRGLTLRGAAGEEIGRWPFGGLVRGAERDAFVLTRRGAAERLEIAEPATRAAFEAALQALPRERRGRMPGGLAVGAVAVLAVVLLAVYGAWRGLSALADSAATLVPDDVVASIDRAGLPGVLDAVAAGPRCETPAGQRALDALAGRLADAGGVRPIDWQVAVYRSDVPNALALPGGTIVVTDALLRRASPDAFAGVLAHEIGHVHLRHGLKAMVHEGGLALMFGMVTGDPGGLVAGAGRLVIGSAYSRDAEREADAFAVTALAALGGDPTALTPFLAAIETAGGDVTGGLLSTHPLGADRADAITAAAAAARRGAGPALTPSDWAAIRSICGDF